MYSYTVITKALKENYLLGSLENIFNATKWHVKQSH